MIKPIEPGDRFGKFTAVACQQQHPLGCKWMLTCDNCGREKWVTAVALCNGRYPWCGCASPR